MFEIYSAHYSNFKNNRKYEIVLITDPNMVDIYKNGKATILGSFTFKNPKDNSGTLLGFFPDSNEEDEDKYKRKNVDMYDTTDSVMPERNDIIPDISVSDSTHKAKELNKRSSLLKDIQKVVRNELLSNRSTTPIMTGGENPLTTSMTQGREYEDSCYKGTENRCPKNPDGTCPPIPDMSNYIKKDGIPCWGCNIDY